MAFDPDAYIAEKSGFDPDSYLAEKGAPVEAEQPTEAVEPEGNFVRDFVLNFMDNPIGEKIIRSAAPTDEDAQKAIDYIRQQSGDLRTGLVETAGTVASGAIAQPVSGLSALAVMPFEGIDQAEATMENVQESLTFQPRTQAGQERVQAVGEAMQPIGEAMQSAREFTGDIGFDIGGPILGAITTTIPDAVISAVGLRQVHKSLPATKLKLKMADKLKAVSAQPELSRKVLALSDGRIPPAQLPVVVKSIEKEIVSKSGIETFRKLSGLADDAARGDANAVKRIADMSDDIGRVSADKTLAKYIANGTDKIKTSAASQDAIKQGFDPGVVTAANGASPLDKTKMLKMVNIMEKGKNNALYAMKNRPSDVAGNSLLERVKFVRNINQQAGSQLDDVAKTLKGQRVNFNGPIDDFIENLDEMGIRLNNKLEPVFKGSDIEGLAGPQLVIKNMVKRISSGRRGTTPDAFEMHKVKRFIDENVTYGKSGEGLKGKTKTIVKKLRHDIDTVLDDNFPEYNRVNQTYAETRAPLDALQDVAGKKMNLSGPNADKAVGTLLRRMMSNTQSRINLVDSVDLMESTAKKYGATFNDDISTQMLFADDLDAVFGPVSKTSLAGETSKAFRDAARVRSVKDVAVDIGAGLIDKARGVNQEAGFKAMRDVLRQGQ